MFKIATFTPEQLKILISRFGKGLGHDALSGYLMQQARRHPVGSIDAAQLVRASFLTKGLKNKIKALPSSNKLRNALIPKNAKLPSLNEAQALAKKQLAARASMTGGGFGSYNPMRGLYEY